MSIDFNQIRIRQFYKVPQYLKQHLESKPFLHNGTYYLVAVENTINYTFFEGDKNWYAEYIQDPLQPDHTPEKFQALLDTFDINKMPKIELSCQEHSNFYWNDDGTHRLAILKYKKLFENKIPLKHINIRYSEFLITDIKNMLKKTTEKRHYNGWSNGHDKRLEHGYHSFNMYNMNIEGQRNPKRRFEKIKPFYDFTDKKVLDLGCNTGGMLFHIPEIAEGVGLDFDSECIKVCNFLKERFLFSRKLTFLEKDLNDFDVSKLDFKPDIVFILSLGSWVKNWKTLYASLLTISNTFLLETNNDKEGAPQLDFFKNNGAFISLLSNCSDDDITGNHLRKTYLIKIK